MGLAKKGVEVFLLMMMMAVCGVVSSMGAVYKVGDSAGWTNTVHFDYKAWSASKTFHVGDTILFEYNKQFQNVIRVTHKNFKACNATAAYFTLNSGNDSFIIRRSGHFYFICDLPGHCEAGQKVDIRVPRTSPPTPTSPPPSSSPISDPHSPSRSPSPSTSGGVAPSLSAPYAPVAQNSASSLPLLEGLLAVLALSISGFAHLGSSFL